MGEPRPPPGAPVLLLVLSLAGSGGGGQETKAVFVDQKSFPDQNLPGHSGSKGDIGAALGESKDYHPQDWLKPLAWIHRGSTLHRANVGVAFAAPGLETRLHHQWPQKGTGRDACPAQQSLQKLLHPWEKLPEVQQFRARGRRQRALFLPLPAPSGTKRLAAKAAHAQEDQSRLTLAGPTFREEKDPWKPADTARRTLSNHPGGASVVPGHHHATKRGAQPSLSSAATEVRAAHEAKCRCQLATVAVQEMEARKGGVRVPTPRTEEAAWAASALTFLLVLLTLAVLYTRLHRKCRRGPSLYWMSSSEEGRETVAAVMKRRLFSRPRRSKRSRQPPQLLLASSSSDDESPA